MSESIENGRNHTQILSYKDKNINRQFHSACKHQRKHNSHSDTPLIYISLEGVDKTVTNINLYKATGTDEIPANMLSNFGVES